MIVTLFFTVLVEGLIVLGFCVWQAKPARSVLWTTLWANLSTQLFLWVALTVFFDHYLVALLIAELLIWWIEGLALYSVRGNQLQFWEAMTLSLGMNLVSVGLGWFLPV